MEEESYKENDEERGKNSAQTGAECTRRLPYLVADKDTDVGSKDTGTALCNGYQVDELLLGNPSLLFHYFILDDRKHGIAAAQRESPDLEKGLESIPIEAFRG